MMRSLKMYLLDVHQVCLILGPQRVCRRKIHIKSDMMQTLHTRKLKNYLRTQIYKANFNVYFIYVI